MWDIDYFSQAKEVEGYIDKIRFTHTDKQFFTSFKTIEDFDWCGILSVQLSFKNFKKKFLSGQQTLLAFCVLLNGRFSIPGKRFEFVSSVLCVFK